GWLRNDSLEMVVNSDGKRLFGVVLANAMQIKVALDVGRLGHVLNRSGRCLARFRNEFLIEDVLAKNDTVVANVDAGPGNQLFDFGMGFSTETAKSNVCRARHKSESVFFTVGQTGNFLP